jgi:hypothetical protein
LADKWEISEKMYEKYASAILHYENPVETVTVQPDEKHITLLCEMMTMLQFRCYISYEV